MLLAAALLAVAVIYPLLVPNYLITVGMLMFFTAFIGQSWNVAGGFAGQTSFGHAVFFGVGAYTSTILHVSLRLESVARLAGRDGDGRRWSAPASPSCRSAPACAAPTSR